MQSEKPDDYYAQLGVDKTASADEIKKAYRKKARKIYPDAGGSVEEFQQLSLIVEVLTDDAKRARYDETGEAAPDLKTLAMQNIQGLIDAAFCQDDEKQDPLGWIRQQVESARGQMSRQKARLERQVKAIEKRKEKFARQNANTQNTKGRDFMLALMAQRIESINRQIKLTEQEVEVSNEVMKFFDYLESPKETQVDQMMRQYANSLNTKFFYGSGWQ